MSIDGTQFLQPKFINHCKTEGVCQQLPFFTASDTSTGHPYQHPPSLYNQNLGSEEHLFVDHVIYWHVLVNIIYHNSYI